MVVCACSHGGPKPEPPDSKIEVQLAPQPVIKNGVRRIYSIDLSALPVGDRAAAFAHAVRTIRARLQLAGIASHVAVDGEKIVVDLMPASPEVMVHATDLVVPTGHLEFRYVDTDSPFMTALAHEASSGMLAQEDQITAESDHWATDKADPITEWYLLARDRDRGVNALDAAAWCPRLKPTGDQVLVCGVSGRTAIEVYLGEIAKRNPTLVVPADRELLFQDLRATRAWRTYLLERAPAVTGERVTSAKLETDPDTNQSSVVFQLDRSGATTLAEVSVHHAYRKLAVLVDGRVWAASIYAGPIRDGRISVSSRDDEPAFVNPEPPDLVILVASGELPGSLTYEVQARLVDGVAKDF